MFFKKLIPEPLRRSMYTEHMQELKNFSQENGFDRGAHAYTAATCKSHLSKNTGNRVYLLNCR